MKKYNPSGAGAVALGLMLAAGAASAAPTMESADHGTSARLISGVYTPADRPLLEKAQYVWGGRSYCWYDNGWQGAGFYRCGYAWRRGWGWGGPAGWHGWGRGGYRGYHHGYYHGGGYDRGYERRGYDRGGHHREDGWARGGHEDRHNGHGH